ncbi:family 43 glycosylhydrolase [Zunongwangia sp. HRR-M8]|uniref:family 43 glycosylhydrolase n=1 Tax=Zunongwangia sp. HRR-M8 TaxID=3015170 RepID=UPI0022DD9F94|nr:family 43 glycosylhydrolase [Zunongwangia sp. HRR-M8]WBL21639.1 family 43 glycosylhydrolase [Zunongwangia sp. HRR-M8]
MRTKFYLSSITIFLLSLSLIQCKQAAKEKESEVQSKDSAQTVMINNPIVDGDFADPSIVKYEGKYYIYATIDPWGGEELGVLESSDFKNWEQKHIAWPTKTLCTSPTSNDSKVWAPSVIQGKDGKFYMYISVGSEVWAGVSEHPLGPWKNMKEDNSPLIKGDMFPEYHMIDAEVFIDDDKQVYLYWGSGLNWVNGHCFVVKLEDDMKSFNKEEIKDVTPPNYFEAPLMLKENGKYYLMYSDGKCTNETYKVRYAIGDTPYGPWKEGENSPVLTTSEDKTTLGPGHHTVFKEGDQHYILYHRIKNNEDELFRELAIDSLNFDNNGKIKKINPSGVIMPKM